MPRILFSLIFVSSLIGCSSIKGNSEPSLSQQARIWIDQSPALEVLESRASQESLVVKFRVYAKDSEDYRIFDAQASWSADDLASDITVALRIIEDGELTSAGASQEVLNVSEEHWRGFRYALAHAITPAEPLSGVALRSHEDELVFFYDEQDRLQVMDLKEKPVAIEVTATLDQRQLMEKIVQAMESYAARHGLAGRRFLFQVDNEDDYTAPFL